MQNDAAIASLSPFLAGMGELAFALELHRSKIESLS
jgi:hypothetical protein